jgi:hypothetical protein
VRLLSVRYVSRQGCIRSILFFYTNNLAKAARVQRENPEDLKHPEDAEDPEIPENPEDPKHSEDPPENPEGPLGTGGPSSGSAKDEAAKHAAQARKIRDMGKSADLVSSMYEKYTAKSDEVNEKQLKIEELESKIKEMAETIKILTQQWRPQ